MILALSRLKPVIEMRKKPVIAGGLLIAFAMAITGIIFSCPSEPMYDGKPLSFWLSRYTDENRTETSVQEADHALEAIGSNAVPTLLKLIKARDLPFEPLCVDWLRKQHLIRIEWSSEQDKRALAVYGFRHLRSASRIGVPELVKIYEQAANDGSRSATERRTAVIESLRRIGSAAKDAVPMLIALPLRDTNVYFRATAVDALGEIHSNPEASVPALIQCFDDPDKRLRSTVAHALGQFGADAKAAVPHLKTLLKDSDFQVQVASLNALQRIAPAVANESDNAEGLQAVKAH